MFDVDRSSARGEMSKRKLIVFKHDSKLGDVPAHILFDMVKVSTDANPVRNYTDYKITLPTQNQMPKGVTVIEM
jgi:CRISPR-associated protein Csd2